MPRFKYILLFIVFWFNQQINKRVSLLVCARRRLFHYLYDPSKYSSSSDWFLAFFLLFESSWFGSKYFLKTIVCLVSPIWSLQLRYQWLHLHIVQEDPRPPRKNRLKRAHSGSILVSTNSIDPLNFAGNIKQKQKQKQWNRACGKIAFSKPQTHISHTSNQRVRVAPGSKWFLVKSHALSSASVGGCLTCLLFLGQATGCHRLRCSRLAASA